MVQISCHLDNLPSLTTSWSQDEGDRKRNIGYDREIRKFVRRPLGEFYRDPTFRFNCVGGESGLTPPRSVDCGSGKYKGPPGPQLYRLWLACTNRPGRVVS